MPVINSLNIKCIYFKYYYYYCAISYYFTILQLKRTYGISTLRGKLFLIS